MSLKCSLFGCKYGDLEVHREREENGSEVVITTWETRTCSRCGDVRVVSENKEVTTMETAADIVADDLQEESPGETPPTGPEGQPPDTTTARQEAGSSPDDGGTVIPDAETDEPVTAGRDEGPTGSPSAPEAAEDDGVILDEEADDDREPGEWPEEPDDGDDAADHSTDDGGEVLTDDAGEWPEEPDDSDDTWEQPIDEEAPIDGATQFGSPGDVVSVPEGEFYCPECEYTAPVESSSLREGDYCPECHRGSLERRTE
jgi:ssDNA-binding Zn-finger/Zn-ribbon topoisomerase 1